MTTTTLDWDDKLFRHRNREYGAYVLRKSYVKHTLRALIIAVSAVAIGVAVPFVKAYIEAKLESLRAKQKKQVITELMEPPPIDKKNEPPPPPIEQPPPPPQRAQIKFVPPQVVKEEEAKREETIANIDTLMKVDPGTKDVQGDPNAIPEITEGDGKGTQPAEVAEQKEEDPDPTAFVVVEKEPSPVNMDDIKKRIVYPPLAKEANIQGKVIVRVLVSKDGKYERHIVLRSPHKLLTEAVEKELPNLQFTPGIQAGKPIKVWVTIPFDFSLK
ncbi:MAG: TonB family protein [Bacteroidia bacterium]|nr:TonB family protein [Bacteroidia bacterium]MCX7652362.1 TonB family protein [Bacteroidia bacterium]MDW8417664.1 TonB family protein [Bacteroidia bacterium]